MSNWVSSGYVVAGADVPEDGVQVQQQVDVQADRSGACDFPVLHIVVQFLFDRAVSVQTQASALSARLLRRGASGIASIRTTFTRLFGLDGLSPVSGRLERVVRRGRNLSGGSR